LRRLLTKEKLLNFEDQPFLNIFCVNFVIKRKMSASDEELEQLLRRTRASRDRINARLAALGEAFTNTNANSNERISQNIKKIVFLICFTKC
jgi:hypothetical protein